MNQKAKRLLQIIDQHQHLSVTELAKLSAMPRTSLLRYLALLEKNGQVIKTFGEVQIRQSHRESHAATRLNAHLSAKQAIALAAAKHVQKGDTIFLDGGSTTYYLARALAALEVTIYTNNLLLCQLINRDFEPQVFTIGGKVNKLTLVTASTQSVLDIKDLRFDKCFIGFNALVDNWFSTTNEAEMVLKRQVIKQTAPGQAYLVGRHNKSSAHADFTFIHRDEVKLISAEEVS